MTASDPDFDIIIIGGGPCGLVLAHELGRRSVSTGLFNDRPATSPYPQAGATQARTMEHYRRLGLSERIRKAGLPLDWPTDVLYTTRYSREEIARLSMPSSASAGNLVRSLSGSWSAAELPHRCSQMLVEKILYEEARSLKSVDLSYGWNVTDITELDDCIEITAVGPEGQTERFSARYAVGADAARGVTRRTLGVKYEGETSMDRPFLSGLMLSVYFRSPEFYKLIGHAPAWQYWAINPVRRGMTISLNGKDEFVFITQMRPGEEVASLTEDEIRSILFTVMGRDYDLEIISRAPWTAGLALVAESFRKGRVFLAGDAAHLFTPTGGLGYNTAVDDAVNLGWKLAAVTKGWGGEALLDSYEQERQPLARRNTGYARSFADSIGRFVVPPNVEDDDAEGAQARIDAGEYLLGHARKEFNIPGVTFGGRYDGSPIIVPDGTEPPEDSAAVYSPTACPGGRAPHAWLADGRSLFDALGFEFSLLCLEGGGGDAGALVDQAAALGVPLTVVDLAGEGLKELYAARFALIRPDQIVCWRGDALPEDLSQLLSRITGRRDVDAQAAGGAADQAEAPRPVQMSPAR